MAVKKPSQPTDATGTVEAASGVQPNRRALCEQRVREVSADLEAGLCTTVEANQRLIEAVMELGKHLLKPQGEALMKQYLEELAETHPVFQQRLRR
jgi:hypothetical protein